MALHPRIEIDDGLYWVHFDGTPADDALCIRAAALRRMIATPFYTVTKATNESLEITSGSGTKMTIHPQVDGRKPFRITT